MSGPVDVLAALRDMAADAKCRTLSTDFCDTCAANEAAIAAVAELIEAVKAIPERSGAPCTSEEWAQDDENLGFSHAFFSRAIRSCRSKAYERGLEKGRQLRAAVARVGGAA